MLKSRQQMLKNIKKEIRFYLRRQNLIIENKTLINLNYKNYSFISKSLYFWIKASFSVS